MDEKSPEFKAWKDERAGAARACTTDTLAAFVRETMGAPHGYGSVVHAVALCAEAAAWAANSDPGARGGLTGFQAGFVSMQFFRSWSRIDGPFRIVRYENMLYPQYGGDFRDREIDAHTWKWLQEQAAEKLANTDDIAPADAVSDHWRSIVAGVVPFGFVVSA